MSLVWLGQVRSTQLRTQTSRLPGQEEADPLQLSLPWGGTAERVCCEMVLLLTVLCAPGTLLRPPEDTGPGLALALH